MYWRFFWISLINVLNANLCCPVNSRQIHPSPALGGDSSVDDASQNLKRIIMDLSKSCCLLRKYIAGSEFFSCFAGHWREKSRSRFWQEAQDSQEKEKERPQRASEASVSIRPVFQRHAGCNQRPKPQCDLWRGLKNCSIHVGQPRRGTKAGKAQLRHGRDTKKWPERFLHLFQVTSFPWYDRFPRKPF